jgi:hypothetical protein
MAANEIMNIVFGKLAESVLRKALENHGRSEDILAFPDDLSFGPIDPLDGDSRIKWISDNFYVQPEGWGVFPRQSNAFFRQANSEYRKIIFWICENSVYEYCGYCECIHRIAGDNLNLNYIDTMETVQFGIGNISGNGFPPRLAHISPVIAAHLIGKEIPVSASLRAERLQTWQRLCTENAPLRTIGPQGVESVPLSHFDPFLLAFADTEWQSARWVITQAAVEANNDNFFRVDLMTLTGRLRALVKEGQLGADGDVTNNAVNVRLR